MNRRRTLGTRCYEASNDRCSALLFLPISTRFASSLAMPIAVSPSNSRSRPSNNKDLTHDDRLSFSGRTGRPRDTSQAPRKAPQVFIRTIRDHWVSLRQKILQGFNYQAEESCQHRSLQQCPLRFRAALNDHAKKNAKRKEHHNVEQLVPEEPRPWTARIVIGKWNPLGRREIRERSGVKPEVKRVERAEQEKCVYATSRPMTRNRRLRFMDLDEGKT